MKIVGIKKELKKGIESPWRAWSTKRHWTFIGLLVVLAMLLTSCHGVRDTDAVVAPIIEFTQSTAPTPSISPSPGVMPETPTITPALTPDGEEDAPISLIHGQAAVHGVQVVAEIDEAFNADTILIQSHETIRDMLISYVIYEYDNHQGPLLEQWSRLYVPEILRGQAIRLALPEADDVLYRIAFTNQKGDYEAYVIARDEAGLDYILMETEGNIVAEQFDESYSDYAVFFPDDFKAEMLRGAFDAFIPKGFCIVGGSLGDINDDGIEDALVMLITGAKRIGVYEGIMPLLILVGEKDGGYTLAARNTRVLYVPYRSDSHAVAGKGYIDIVYNDVDGANSHHKFVSRFPYDSQRDGWYLTEFSYRQLDYDDPLNEPEMIRALPHYAGICITDYTGGEVYQVPTDFSSFDRVATMQAGDGMMATKYTIAVNVNELTGLYEGYIYRHYESISTVHFTGTIRGKYTDNKPFEIETQEDKGLFRIQNDTWVWGEDGHGTFFKK